MPFLCKSMQMYITSLNSGSNGNCYYIGNDHEAVLVDAGICCRQVEKRMKNLDLSMDKVKAIFVSHEHSDHINGIAVLARKHRLPVYITAKTLAYSKLNYRKLQLMPLKAYEPVSIGGLQITAFPKLHDAIDPHSFIIASGEIKVGVFTDIGAPCEYVIEHMGQCHAAFLEANYDETMLEQGRYPYHLKRRIRGGKGHLSNLQALALFTSCKPAFMSHLILSHLSQENNCPRLVEELFTRHADGTEIIVASRYKETPLYTIINQTMGEGQFTGEQLCLFDKHT